jgi:hypothetical protein
MPGECVKRRLPMPERATQSRHSSDILAFQSARMQCGRRVLGKNAGLCTSGLRDASGAVMVRAVRDGERGHLLPTPDGRRSFLREATTELRSISGVGYRRGSVGSLFCSRDAVRHDTRWPRRQAAKFSRRLLRGARTAAL